MALKYDSFKDLRHTLEILRATLLETLEEKDREKALTFCAAIFGSVTRILESPTFAGLSGDDLNEIGNKCQIILTGIVAIQGRFKKGDPSMN